MRIVFAGTPEPALSSLQRLIDSPHHDVIAVLTRPDAAAGRRLSMDLSSPWNLAVFWTDPPRPMVCMEPWTGPRRSLLSGDAKLELAPGASQELHCRYAVTALAP